MSESQSDIARKRFGRLRPYLPNRSDALALVSLNDKRPFRAHWPLTLVQIVGGRTRSLSVVRYRTREPVPITPPVGSDGSSS